MSQFTLTKLSPDTVHEVLQEFLSKKPFKPVFFFSPYALNTWLMHDNKSLYIVTFGEEQVIVVHKEKNNDIRVLFEYPSTGMLAALKDHFKPKYIAINEYITKPESGVFQTGAQYKIKFGSIAALTDKGIRKKYSQAVRKNQGLVYKAYTPADAEKILTFLGEWDTARTEEQNQHSRTYNDRHFLELYKNDPRVIGGIVLDKERVVAYTLCVPSLDGELIALFNKALRGYTELGLFIYVERARQFIAAGFSSAYIGSINNDFKKQFLDDAEVQEAYCQVLHNELKIDNEEMYAWMIF